MLGSRHLCSVREHTQLLVGRTTLSPSGHNGYTPLQCSTQNLVYVSVIGSFSFSRPYTRGVPNGDGGPGTGWAIFVDVLVWIVHVCARSLYQKRMVSTVPARLRRRGECGRTGRYLAVNHKTSRSRVSVYRVKRPNDHHPDLLKVPYPVISPDDFHPSDAKRRARYRRNGSCVDRVVTRDRLVPFGSFFLRPRRMSDRRHDNARRNVNGRVSGSVEDRPQALRDKRRHLIICFKPGGVSTSGRRKRSKARARGPFMPPAAMDSSSYR